MLMAHLHAFGRNHPHSPSQVKFSPPGTTNLTRSTCSEHQHTQAENDVWRPVIGLQTPQKLRQLLFGQCSTVLHRPGLEDLGRYQVKHRIHVNALMSDGPAIDSLHTLKHPPGLVTSASGLDLLDCSHDLTRLERGHGTRTQ